MIKKIKNNDVFLRADRSIFQHGGPATPQRGYDEGGQNLQSQVHVRHVVQEHHVRNDAHQVSKKKKRKNALELNDLLRKR